MRVPDPILRSMLGGAAHWFTPGALPVEIQRAGLELAAWLLPSPPVIRGGEGGVPGERHRYRCGHGRVLLYMHGGGYHLGSPRTHRVIVARLASALDAEAFVPEYLLAPEHPYPAGLEDVVAAYTSVAERFDEVIVAGESAGGGLALALAIHARDHGLRAPAAVGLICPWLDVVGPHEDGGDPIITPDRLERWKAGYAAPGHRADPGVSPVLADLRGLPPIVVHSAGRDPLRADADKLAAKISVEHRTYPDQFHAFHAFAGVIAEADRAVDALAASLLAHCGGTLTGSSSSIAA